MTEVYPSGKGLWIVKATQCIFDNSYLRLLSLDDHISSSYFVRSNQFASCGYL